MRTTSGHATFRPASAKTWESGQRPRKLQPHEMPWARALPYSSSLRPQKSVAKSLAPAASNLASLTSDASLDAAVLAQEEARKEEEVRRMTAAQQTQQAEQKSAVSLNASLCLLCCFDSEQALLICCAGLVNHEDMKSA